MSICAETAGPTYPVGHHFEPASCACRVTEAPSRLSRRRRSLRWSLLDLPLRILAAVRAEAHDQGSQKTRC